MSENTDFTLYWCGPFLKLALFQAQTHFQNEAIRAQVSRGYK